MYPETWAILGHFCFPHDSEILVSIGSSLTGHTWSLHIDSLGLSDPLWVRSSNGRDKKMGFSPLPGPCSSVVEVG